MIDRQRDRDRKTERQRRTERERQRQRQRQKDRQTDNQSWGNQARIHAIVNHTLTFSNSPRLGLTVRQIQTVLNRNFALLPSQRSNWPDIVHTRTAIGVRDDLRQNRHTGLVVKASASRAADPGFNSYFLLGDFFGCRVIPVT